MSATRPLPPATTEPRHHWPGSVDVATDGPLRLRSDVGDVIEFPLDRWLGGVDDVEAAVLGRAEGPVLDIGCGPGRHVAWCTARHVLALGIDVATAPLQLARDRGAFVLRRSVFDAVPAAGCWRTALLLDGSIGIEGDPPRLLGHVRDLVVPNGRLLVELEPPGRGVERTRLQGSGGWFAWAHVGVDAIHAVAAASGWHVADVWQGGHRWFAELSAR